MNWSGICCQGWHRRLSRWDCDDDSISVDTKQCKLCCQQGQCLLFSISITCDEDQETNLMSTMWFPNISYNV